MDFLNDETIPAETKIEMLKLQYSTHLYLIVQSLNEILKVTSPGVKVAFVPTEKA